MVLGNYPHGSKQETRPYILRADVLCCQTLTFKNNPAYRTPLAHLNCKLLSHSHPMFERKTGSTSTSSLKMDVLCLCKGGGMSKKTNSVTGCLEHGLHQCLIFKPCRFQEFMAAFSRSIVGAVACCKEFAYHTTTPLWCGE